MIWRFAKADPATIRIADRLAPEMRQAFLRAVKKLRDKIDLSRLRELLDRGDQGDLGAFWDAFEQEVTPELRPAIREVFLQAAQRTGAPLDLRFDITNPRAVEAINTQAATLIRDITMTSRDAIRAVLREGFQRGVPVPEMARRIRSSIGLSERYARAVDRYRQGQLDAGVAPGKVAERSDRYANRLLRLRATTIARTETIAASAAGQHAAWQEAKAQGLLSGGKRRWIVTPDESLCPNICEPMDGQERGLEEAFTTGQGDSVMHPPAHPACRCAVGLFFPEAA